MDFLLVVVGVIVVATALFFVATLVFGPGEPPEPAGERLATPLPDGRNLTAQDLRAATFPVTVRGYRMADVDALIERVARQVEQRQVEDAEDRGHRGTEPERGLFPADAEETSECERRLSPDATGEPAAHPPREG